MTGFILLPLLAACSADAAIAQGAIEVQVGDLPLVAIWRADDGMRLGSQAPFLRVAIWHDGRAVFSEDPGNWNHALREGTVDSRQVSSLRTRLLATPIFDLEGYCYLVPDAPTDCVLVQIDGRAQILYWDEVEHPNYGINVALRERHRQFIATWHAVNKLALSSLPADSAPSAFEPVPKSWYVKRKIQSR